MNVTGITNTHVNTHLDHFLPAANALSAIRPYLSSFTKNDQSRLKGMIGKDDELAQEIIAICTPGAERDIVIQSLTNLLQK